MRVAAALWVLLLPAQDGDKKPWIGISMLLETDLPAVEGVSTTAAIRIADLPAASPARAAGVRVGDLIVGIEGQEWISEPAEVLNAFRTAIASRQAGDIVRLRIVREEIVGMPAEPVEEYVRKHGELTLKRCFSLLEIKVVLETRPADTLPAKTVPELDVPARDWPEEKLADALIEEKKLDVAWSDLCGRLADLHAKADPWRLRRCAHAHRAPFQLRTLAEETFAKLEVGQAAAWLDSPVAPPPPWRTPLSLEEHLAQLLERLTDARKLRDEAFAALSPDEARFLDQNIDSLGARFEEHYYLDADPDRERYARHVRLLELATRVDTGKLFQAALCLATARDPAYLRDVQAALTKEWEAGGRPGGVFIDRDTPFGRIVVAGHERTWHREKAAVILDLGGDDFYSNPPALLQIDWAGDDAYEATGPWAQGAGRLDVSCLIDVAGHDQYVGTRWAQGVAVLGAGLLFDLAGNDVYRGQTFVQGAALWGIGYVEDGGGDDRYEAHYMSQGLGLPGGAGWLVDVKGRDSYYAKGAKPTTYGDAGIFDAWSQGCGLGFRGHASGGVGLVWDGDGDDRYEAGNFSQGGGYYFGVGLLRDAAGDDRYIGSRYNQGFSAHQAVGYFEDMAGDDRYETRQAVAQGLAWDQSVTLFIDHAGNDVYDGGTSFSQGAAAHNAISVFLDFGGRDVYRHPQQAAALRNEYHGGTSFALFVDAGGDDVYEAPGREARIHFQGEHGFACDLPSSIEDALKDAAFKNLLRP